MHTWKNSSSVVSLHQRFLLQWLKSLLLRFLPSNKNRGKFFHPLTLFGKPWCYCVDMCWYTAPTITRWLQLYLLHQVLLPPLLLEKLKNLIFEMPIIPQTLSINNLRTTRAKSINLHTIRKLIEYSFKKVGIKAMFSLTVFEILMSEGRWVLSQPGYDCIWFFIYSFKI